MKRTIIITITLVTALLLTFSLTNTGSGSVSDTCCQKFQVVSAGSPLSGCVITIDPFPGGVAQCTPDGNLQCQICGLTTGTQYTAVVTCDGKRKGSAVFTACGSTVTINVP